MTELTARKEYSSEDHFRNAVSKCLFRNKVPHSHEWEREFRLQDNRSGNIFVTKIRCDIVAECVSQEFPGWKAFAWIELKNVLGMHELATALGQILLAGDYFQLMRQNRENFAPFVAIPSAIWNKCEAQKLLLQQRGIGVVNEHNIGKEVRAKFQQVLDEEYSAREKLVHATLAVRARL